MQEVPVSKEDKEKMMRYNSPITVNLKNSNSKYLVILKNGY